MTQVESVSRESDDREEHSHKGEGGSGHHGAVHLDYHLENKFNKTN